MIGKASAAVVLASMVVAAAAPPQRAMITRLGGRVMEDGRPIRRIVEIQLVSGSAGMIDTAYTLGGDEFEFRSVPIDLADQYFLVIQEPGYREVRQELQIGRDPFGRGNISDFGLVILYLNRIPEDVSDDSGTSDTVDVRQLAAEISEEARDAYRDALERLDEGDPEAGLESLERAVELAPDYYDALGRLGVEYLTLARYGDARRTLERAHALNANDSVLLTNLGTLPFQEGQVLEQSALDASERGIAIGSYEAAVGYLRDAARLDPNSGLVAFYLGSALYKTGAFDEAEERLLAAMDFDPRLDAARLALINVYVQQQRHEAALEQIELYLEANPDTPDREMMEQARSAIEAAAGR